VLFTELNCNTNEAIGALKPEIDCNKSMPFVSNQTHPWQLIEEMSFEIIPILLIKWSILRQEKLVDNEAKFCYLVVLNKKFSTKLASVLVPQND
jgi:hypothetical protein